jgi:hypothetical protein
MTTEGEALEEMDIGGMKLPLPRDRIVIHGDLELKEGERRRLTNNLEIRGRLILRKGGVLFSGGWRIFTHGGIAWDEDFAIRNDDDESCAPILPDEAQQKSGSKETP